MSEVGQRSNHPQQLIAILGSISVFYTKCLNNFLSYFMQYSSDGLEIANTRDDILHSEFPNDARGSSLVEESSLSAENI